LAEVHADQRVAELARPVALDARKRASRDVVQAWRVQGSEEGTMCRVLGKGVDKLASYNEEHTYTKFRQITKNS
jgi:hypothetical protein